MSCLNFNLIVSLPFNDHTFTKIRRGSIPSITKAAVYVVFTAPVFFPPQSAPIPTALVI